MLHSYGANNFEVLIDPAMTSSAGFQLRSAPEQSSMRITLYRVLREQLTK